MKQAFLSRSMKFIIAYKSYTDEEIEKLRYGLEGLYLTITKLVVICTLAIFLDMVKDLFLLLILFNVIRFSGFGFHANKSSECLIFSTILFIGLPSFMKYFAFGNFVFAIVGGIGVIILAIYAPADTVKRPLPNVRKRKFRKIVTTCTAIIYMLLALFIHNTCINYLFIVAIILEAVMVNPFTYKIFGQPYRNYLAYQ